MPKFSRGLLTSAVAGTLLTSVGGSAFAAAPSGPHPRLWLDAATKQGLAAQAGTSGSPVARGHQRCSAARTNPSDYEDGGWQGFEFVLTLSGCLASYQATNDADDLATAIKYWNVLLDDYSTVGDGAGGDAVVTHDTGYAMRTFAPYSAIAYDWLHDAPGVTEELRAHARERFDAWVTYYTKSGYLKDLAGANYEAGYAFAATLIAIAEAGEAGSVGDAHWATVHDTIWTKDLVPAFATGGVLEGGDWPEGWQYGPLSVTEHALAARAMIDNGTPLPGASAWADSLVMRFFYGLTPSTKQSYAGGDSDNDTANRTPENGALLAAIAGPASDSVKAYARQLNSDLGLKNENALFDAIALAKAGTTAALPSDLAKNYLAKGNSTWYLRGSFADDSIWSVFQCSRRLVDDHQHNDAGNWVLTRGADDLVVDPSPYGTLSSLTGNAPAVDSGSLPSGYSPSQGYWGKDTGLRWARQSASGVAAARCDYADQFRSDDVPSDVTVALRDYVLVPDGNSGEVVLVDRVVTGDSARGLHYRVRSAGNFALAGGRATAKVGASSLAVEPVYTSSGSPSVRAMPQASECDSGDHACDVSRLSSGTEYRIDVAGPEAMAIHVITARGATDTVAAHEQLQGTGYRGVVTQRAAGPVAVITNAAADGATGSAFSYKAPSSALHVVLDAPTDAAGKSDVTAKRDGTTCSVEVRAHQGSSGGFDGKPLVVKFDQDCAVSDDGTQMLPAPNGDPTPVAMSDGGAGGETAGGNASAGQGPSGLEPMTSNGASGGKGSGTGGTASMASGGTFGASGSGSNSAKSEVASATSEPTTPGMSSCSVNATGRDGGAAGTLASLALGTWLLSRKRRELGFARR